MTLGIVTGLLAALGHSLSYLATRWFTADRGRPVGQLLVQAHVLMGGVALGAMPWVWLEGLTWSWSWLWRLGCLLGFFVVAQVSLLTAVRLVDASRVSPLLGAKIAVLAVITVGQGEALGWAQWVAVGLAVGAAWLLNAAGGRLPWRVTVLVGLACVAYAIADTFIEGVVREVERLSAAGPLAARPGGVGVGERMAGPIFTVSAVYGALGVVGAAMLPWFGSRSWGAWRDTLPYAGIWLSSMVALYTAFATAGLVLGAILQSARGIFSIVLGMALAAWGWHHLEQRHGWGVQARRLGAAALMCLAVYLYVRR
ncbi:MAG: hypothetical protein AAFX76_06445 [Planctomycetota bacterium]